MPQSLSVDDHRTWHYAAKGGSLKAQIGVIGLAVMGENIALNIERNGFPIAVYNRSYDKTERFMSTRAQGKQVTAARTLEEFVAALESPRRILLMVQAGKPVDAVIESLKPLLDKGDIIIDGGNSHYPNTERRAVELEKEGLRFFGMGVSGGEEGALWGPSLMPGGDKETYTLLEPVLRKIAAKADGEDCVTYVGARSAGHFVKMVHNGIEYGDMQLIAEAYDLMRYGLQLSSQEIASIFTEWNQSELQSYLIEITSHIVNFQDDQADATGLLIDKIVDSAGQKGTGKWTTVAALNMGIPIPTITAAVDARILSAQAAVRKAIPNQDVVAPDLTPDQKQELIQSIKAALYASKICSYAQGFHLIQAASQESQYGVRLDETARIWKAGCIIRAGFLDKIRTAYAQNPNLTHLFLDPDFARDLEERSTAWRKVVQWAIEHRIPMPATATSLAYYDSLRRERLPANLIQGQRDFFGAHTYKRTDREGTFHTQWPSLQQGE
ncbi:MAG: NADP-dependent phosphogluconate dehydrogenase [Myxococcales bacterium]|nr:NADP-dependent phosphogluconate dehydrogenase [Myxococcales bacterium]MCB9644466.1 NADP-dependent phosphogluconate dehydrogenase [Myxococcales bacterium]